MPLKKGEKIARGYATVDDDDDGNYRYIADLMCEIGYIMNHSSVRNYILRTMRKFAQAVNVKLKLNLTSDKIDELAKSPLFQSGISDLLRAYEDTKSGKKNANKDEEHKSPRLS